MRHDFAGSLIFVETVNTCNWRRCCPWGALKKTNYRYFHHFKISDFTGNSFEFYICQTDMSIYYFVCMGMINRKLESAIQYISSFHIFTHGLESPCASVDVQSDLIPLVLRRGLYTNDEIKTVWRTVTKLRTYYYF